MDATRVDHRPRVLVALKTAIVLALVWLLAPVGVASVPPVREALAAEEEQTVEKVNVATEADLVEATQRFKSSEATVVLASNIVLRSPLTIRDGMDVKIDLKGRTLSRDLDGFETDGHVILIEEFGTLNVVDTSAKGSGKISGGRAQNGGGIYNLGTLNLTGGTIVDCKAQECGGGIHNSGTMTLTSTWIEKCDALGGGGIYNRGTATVGAKIIQDNNATEIGGGILNDAHMTLTRCTLKKNTSRTAGAIASRIVSFTEDTSLVLSGCTITANTATHLVGGIYGTRIIGDAATEAKGKEHKGTLTIGGATKITNNSSPTVGGVLCNYGYSIALTGATITGNASASGGWYVGAPVAGGVSFFGKANQADKDPSATFSLEGKNIIKNNKCASVASDVMISSDDKIEVTEKIETGTSIGLTPVVGPIQEFTHGYSDFVDELPNKFFFTPAARSVKLRHGEEVGLVEPVPYVDAKGNDAVTDDYDLADGTSGTDWYANTYVAYRNETLKERPTMHGDVDLILRDGVEVDFAKGIELPRDSGSWTNLHILGQSQATGTLTAEGATGYPGIGGRGATYSRLYVHAGTVMAEGGKWGAGIGGGEVKPGDSSRLEVEVLGGTLTANGGKAAAGIGCGSAGGLRGKVTIHGGDVNAVATDGGAGIGGAAHAPDYIDVEFLGGTTLASSSNYKGAGAVGYGVGKEGFAEVSFGENMSVLAGGGNVDAHKRVSTCQDTTYAIIQPCTHKAQDYYCNDESTHEVWCRYCGANRHAEPHQMAWDHTCACGYKTPTYAITYQPNGGKGATYVGEAVVEGETCTLLDCTEIWGTDGAPPSGLRFLCWGVDGKRLQPGDTITMTSDVTVKAIWNTARTLTFAPGDGQGTAYGITVAEGTKLTLPDCTFTGPDGKGFTGWKTQGRFYYAGGTVTVSRSFVFYAQWGMNWATLQATIDAAADGDTIVLTNDVRATAADGPLKVAAGKNVTIDLAGHTIDRALSTPTKDGYCIYVAGTLDIVDSSERQRGLITGANNANRRQGRGHDLVGGGIVVDEGTVTLTGGTVAGNEALDGAGVQLVCSGSTFSMSGATIKDNVGHGAGAGVYVAYGSTFAMNGGTITGNAVPASQDLLPGEEGAGVYATGTFELAGTVTIADNTAGDNRASNVYLANRNVRIRVTDSLEPTTPIGVTTTPPNPIFYITDGLTSHGSIDDFVAEDSDQVVAADGDEAVMRKPKTLTFSPGTERVEGTMEVAHVAYGTAYPLPEPGFTSVAHSTFLGWSIEGRTYAVGEEYVPRGNATATALWDGTFEVSFDAGEGTGECEPVYVAHDTTYALPEECPFKAPTGRSFIGWKVGEKTYGPGDEVTVDGPLTATAVWDMDWAGLQEILNTGDEISVTLPHDIVAAKGDGPLRIPEDRLVSIDLAGHKLDRAAGASSTGSLQAEASSVPAGAVFDLSGGYTDLSITDSVGGGEITGARAAAVFAGGGPVVYIDLTDVTVTGNEVLDGICDVSGRLTLVRSSITGNHGTTCGGVHVGDCALTLDAGSTITDNTCRGNPSNVRLAPDATIDVSGLLADRAIGVTCDVEPRSGAPVRLTSGLLGCGDEGSITSDKESCLTMVLSDDEAYLTVPVRVTIEGGEGTGSMEVDPLPEGMDYPLPDCRFKPPAGQAFDAWRLTWSDGRPNEEREAGARVELTGDLTLTALYVDHTHVLRPVDEKDPTCTAQGWIAHWACSGCGRHFADESGAEELDEEKVLLPATGHTPGLPVVENEVPATTEVPGSHDSVTYCSVCGREISRLHVTENQLEPSKPGESSVHECVAGDYVVVSEIAPTCEEAGSVQEATYCTVCNREMDRRFKFIAALGHDWGDPTYVWAEDLSCVTATRVCARDASHTETETAETEPYPVPIGDGTQELVTFTATFENPAFASVSREKLIATAGDEQPDDEDDTGKTEDKNKGDSDSKDNKDNKNDKGDGNKGEQSTPSSETWPSAPVSAYVPTSSVPFGPQGGAYGGLSGIGRRIGSTMSPGNTLRTNGDSTNTNTNSNTSTNAGAGDQSSGAMTRSTTSTTGTTASSGSMGATATPATGAQAAAGATQNAGGQTTSSAQSVTQPVSATQVTGDQGAGTADGTARTAASPLATTADPSRAPGLVAFAGATTLGVATLGRIWRRGRKTR